MAKYIVLQRIPILTNIFVFSSTRKTGDLILEVYRTHIYGFYGECFSFPSSCEKKRTICQYPREVPRFTCEYLTISHCFLCLKSIKILTTPSFHLPPDHWSKQHHTQTRCNEPNRAIRRLHLINCVQYDEIGRCSSICRSQCTFS